MGDISAIRTALGGVTESLATDGYSLRIVELDGPALRLAIEAGPDACDECLVPKETMAGIIMQTLGSDLGVSKVDLTYPADK